MKISRVYRSITKLVERYNAKLALTEEEDFMLTPPSGGWSFSEVYAHIFDSSLLSAVALRKAIDGKGVQASTSWAVKVILFLGAFPPGRKYNVPAKLMSRVKKISRQDAYQLMKDFELRLSGIYPDIGTADLKGKTTHPRLGPLNAKQWLRFIEIHLRHHLKQLDRIDKDLAN